MTDNKQPKEVEKKEQNHDDDKNLAQQRKGRVIIRNLIYDINEKLLKGLLGKFGEITEISIPVNPSNNKSKGFAFIQFSNKNCALKAINELNGSQWKGRRIVLDLAVSKDEYKSTQDKNDDSKTDKKDDKKSKEEKKENDDEMEDEDEEDEEDDDDEDDEEDEDDDEDMEDEEDDEEEDEEDNKKQKKQQKTEDRPKKNFDNEDISQTVFVRNLAYDATDKDLRDFCSTFGKVEMAKVCMNHETGSNKGTGFVKFKDPSIGRKLIAQSDEQSQSYLKNKHKKDKNIHDIFSGVSELDLEMNGRRIIFLEAKKRDDVARFMEEKNERNSITLDKVKSLEQLEMFDRQGKRNIHLAKLGIFEEEKNMSPEEKQKRRAHLEEKLTKLKNPNNQVSSTRVALMNLPKEDFQEEEIKLYAQAALIKEYGNDYLKKQNPIKQVLLLRDKNKADKDGIPKSRGIGFIEFNTHEEALQFLEYSIKDKLNFEKKYKKTPIIEFSIEDIRKMQKKNKIIEKVKQKQKEKNIEKKPKTKEEREEKRVLLHNANNAAKLKIEQILKQSNTTNMKLYEEGRSLLKDIVSRGIKQRMAKLLKKKFKIESPEENQTTNKFEEAIKKNEEKVVQKNTKEEKRKQLLKKKVQEEKIQKKEEIKQKKQQEEEELEADASELIKAVSRELKKNKRRKQEAEDHDELDEVLQNHLVKKIKKAKQESSAL